MHKYLVILVAMLIAASSAFAATKTAVLEVDNMACPACPVTVRKALEKVPGVASARVDYKTKRAVVAFDSAKTTIDTLTKATGDAGFSSSVKQIQ